eukprot:TRINITY_DN4614_c0_g1_i1.p1 TRINITY_DN4614_c0_g1~~TRINITY_DN4614_c0_g1_i1.p1  ORF type:complete len:228 (+),score=36.14 TRINITY_DN4614_c0_g1_i1:61-744(+)
MRNITNDQTREPQDLMEIDQNSKSHFPSSNPPITSHQTHSQDSDSRGVFLSKEVLLDSQKEIKNFNVRRQKGRTDYLQEPRGRFREMHLSGDSPPVHLDQESQFYGGREQEVELIPRRNLKRRRSPSPVSDVQSTKKKRLDSSAANYQKSSYKSTWNRGILQVRPNEECLPIRIVCKVDWGWMVTILDDSVTEPETFYKGCKYWVKWSGLIDSENEYLPIVYPIHVC